MSTLNEAWENFVTYVLGTLKSNHDEAKDGYQVDPERESECTGKNVIPFVHRVNTPLGEPAMNRDPRPLVEASVGYLLDYTDDKTKDAKMTKAIDCLRDWYVDARKNDGTFGSTVINWKCPQKRIVGIKKTTYQYVVVYLELKFSSSID